MCLHRRRISCAFSIPVFLSPPRQNFNEPALKIVASGSGVVNVKNAKVSAMTVDMKGAGDVVLAAPYGFVAASLGLDNKGTGSLYADAFKARSVGLWLYGSGGASVFATEGSKVENNGTGAVTIRGNPVNNVIKGSVSFKRLRG